MLSGIKIFSSDEYWRRIAFDFGATLVDNAKFADANIDVLRLKLPITPIAFHAAIIAASDNDAIITKVFGRHVELSPIQKQIIVKLYQNGGMSAEEIKIAIGYAKDTATHTVETAIYGLRKMFGHDFIINENGLFKIGGI